MTLTRRHARTLFVVALSLAAALCLAAALKAQTAPDPSGHWEGSLQAPAMEVPFAIDFAKTDQGQLLGTVNLPMEHITGLPLLHVAMEGATITFYARKDQPMIGTLSTDGRTISGEYFAGGSTVPFTMTRSGDAKIDPPVTSAAVSKDIEGTWSARLAANGLEIHVVLTVANRPDGRAVADIVNLDQGGLRLPLAIVQNGASVTLTSTVVPSQFGGAVNAAGELAGTFTQGTLSIPVTFRRN